MINARTIHGLRVRSMRALRFQLLVSMVTAFMLQYTAGNGGMSCPMAVFRGSMIIYGMDNGVFSGGGM